VDLELELGRPHYFGSGAATTIVILAIVQQLSALSQGGFSESCDRISDRFQKSAHPTTSANRGNSDLTM
jgi:hypothetical protein